MKKYNRAVRYWLLLGCILLFFQIIIGGITRITGSGLSITKWEIVTGTFPPLNAADWNSEFDLYKETPQYQKINEGMSLKEFKFIYFWEYFHRLWARMMGLIFLIPLIFFLLRSYIDARLLKLLTAVFLSAALAAVFGWIMVASGLVDRPWVNAYKLSIHLSIALCCLAFLLWTSFTAFAITKSASLVKYRKLIYGFFILLCIQLFLGGIMSGTRASLVYPTWPQIGTNFFPPSLFNISNWSVDNIVNYDKNGFATGLYHLLHRGLGYIVFIYGIYLSYKVISNNIRDTYKAAILLIILLITQVLLGVITLLLSKGTIPVLFGVLHQGVAILLFALTLYLLYRIAGKSLD